MSKKSAEYPTLEPTTPLDLEQKLESCDPDVQHYIVQLKAILFKLHETNIKIKADHDSLSVRIKALEESVKTQTFMENIHTEEERDEQFKVLVLKVFGRMGWRVVDSDGNQVLGLAAE